MDERTTQPRLEYVPLAALRAFPKNPKLHDTQSIHDSYQRFGFISPIIIDEKTGNIVAGHGRLETLLAMKSRGEQPPARIIVKDEHWLVPVIRGLSFDSEKEAEAYLLADNELTIAAGFNEKLLAEILPEHATNVAGLGFSQEELQKYIPQFRTIEVEPEIPQVIEQAVSKAGDLWVLGPHRVLCGDSTKPEDVAKLGHVDITVTDPPYNVGVHYTEQTNDNQNFEDYSEWSKSWLKSAPQKRIFTVGIKRLFWWGSIAGQPQWIIAWIKRNGQGNTALGGTNKWDAILIYGCKPDNDVDIIEVQNDYSEGIKAEGAHPTAKPTELFSRLIQRFSSSNETVFDPFLGSGTTLIAAQQLGRVCFGVEIEPRYVDVAVKRWQNLTHKDARLGETGPTFTQVQAERLKA